MPLTDDSMIKQFKYNNHKDLLRNTFPRQPLIVVRSDVNLGEALQLMEKEAKNQAEISQQSHKMVGFDALEWLKTDFDGPLTLNVFPAKETSFCVDGSF